MKFKVGDRVKFISPARRMEVGLVCLINDGSDNAVHVRWRDGKTYACKEEHLSFADNEMQRLIRFQNKRRVRDELAAKT